MPGSQPSLKHVPSLFSLLPAHICDRTIAIAIQLLVQNFALAVKIGPEMSVPIDHFSKNHKWRALHT